MVEVAEWNKKMAPYLPLLSCESPKSVKENPHGKNNTHKKIYNKERLLLSKREENT